MDRHDAQTYSNMVMNANLFKYEERVNRVSCEENIWRWWMQLLRPNERAAQTDKPTPSTGLENIPRATETFSASPKWHFKYSHRN